MKKDYPELEGKRIRYLSDGYDLTGIVTGCNYDIGISVKNVDDGEDYLMCVLGPSSPQVTQEWGDIEFPEDDYKHSFTYIVDMIEKGVIDFNKSLPVNERNISDYCPTEESCPWGA